MGGSIQESCEGLRISADPALQVLLPFDRAINSTLSPSVRNRADFEGSLNTYEFCDNVWAFVLYTVEFREGTELIKQIN